MELWPSFNFEENLRKGFAQTGIYPFSPAVIRSTVTPEFFPETILDPEVDIFRSLKKRLRQPLGEMNLSPENTDAVISFADRLARGMFLMCI